MNLKHLFPSKTRSSLNVLYPLQQWLDHLKIRDRHVAHRIAKLVPAQCPFERHITCCGRTIAYIPPLCKLNPFYEQLVGLRFRALCCLAEEWGEDISAYC
jgi:Mo-dependent nitrogenase C-terminus